MKIEVKKPGGDERKSVTSWRAGSNSGKATSSPFSKGLACVWDIKAPVRKHYNFR